MRQVVPEFDDEPDVFAPLIFLWGADFLTDPALEGVAVVNYNKQVIKNKFPLTISVLCQQTGNENLKINNYRPAY